MPIGQPPSPGTPPQTVYGLSPAQVNELNRQLAMGEATQRATTGNPMFAELFEGSFAAGYIPPVERNWQPVELSSGTVNADGTYNGWWNVTNLGTHENQTVIRIKPASGQRLAMGQYYLGFFSHYDEVEEVAVFQVLDAPAGNLEWTAVQTADYTALVGECVPFAPTSADCIATLPASPYVGQKCRLVYLTSATKFVRVLASGADKLNGGTPTADKLSPGFGYWDFEFAEDAAIGWVCSRELNG